MVLGVVPVVVPTPMLSNATTRRSAASASTRAGSQLSRLPRKCCNRTSGTSPSPSSRYAYSTALSAAIRRIEASAYLIRASPGVRSSVIVMRQSVLVGASAGGRGPDRLGRLLDQVGDLGGMGDHRDVARRNLDGGRAHPRRELALSVRRDRLVVLRDEVPRRERLPRRHAHHVGEGRGRQGLLYGVHDLCLG